MNSNELISSRILSDVEIIADIYNIVKTAGLNATKKESVINSQNDTCVILANQLGVNRLSTECYRSGTYPVKYDSNDITIVGGAALNIYDYKLKDFKERRGVTALEDYIKKKTSDIDIVWWPRPSTNQVIITSKSEAIIQLVEAFKIELLTDFDENKKSLEAKIKPYIPGVSDSDILTILVNASHVRPAGVFNINISFHIKNTILKICDIIVHDSGASQRYDSYGNEITYVSFMKADPIYGSPNPGNDDSIRYLNVNGIDIAVPNIKAFIKQQMLAFDNFIRVEEPKGLINYKRVEFIKKLLSSFKLNNNNNKQAYTDLLEVFTTNSKTYLLLIINAIDSRVNESIIKLYENISKVCSTLNTSTDKIVSELCTKAKDIQQLPNYYLNERIGW